MFVFHLRLFPLPLLYIFRLTSSPLISFVCFLLPLFLRLIFLRVLHFPSSFPLLSCFVVFFPCFLLPLFFIAIYLLFLHYIFCCLAFFVRYISSFTLCFRLFYYFLLLINSPSSPTPFLPLSLSLHTFYFLFLSVFLLFSLSSVSRQFI